MKKFREIAIEEALKIVKKGDSSMKIKKPLQRDRESKDNFIPKIDISYFDKVKIIKSKHIEEIRDGELLPRDEGLRDAVIIRVIKKAWKKGLSYGKTMITYKNKKKKYDMLVIDWKKNQDIIILVTSIQDSKKSPKQYFGPKHKDDNQIMTEAELQIIELEEI
jgi:hypothetical protein